MVHFMEERGWGIDNNLLMHQKKTGSNKMQRAGYAWWHMEWDLGRKCHR